MVMKQKNAQVRSMETIGVLFIFFILVVFALIFYAQYQRGAYERARLELVGQRAVASSLRAQFLPELRCSTGNNHFIDDCVDRLRMEGFQQVAAQNRQFYLQVFGTAKISVTELYPGNHSWTLFNESLAGASRKLTTPTPVSIYDPLSPEGSRFSFGVLNVDVFS